ncbi:hypothetical protein QJS66_01995 [Kocuria rhizophila]|nr:hypothetical protein QJS66_01995 [Kocuria rhizophila]
MRVQLIAKGSAGSPSWASRSRLDQNARSTSTRTGRDAAGPRAVAQAGSTLPTVEDWKQLREGHGGRDANQNRRPCPPTVPSLTSTTPRPHHPSPRASNNPQGG